METNLQLPDGSTVRVKHENELTDDDIKNIAKEMGQEVNEGITARDVFGEGTRIAGAVGGAIRGSRGGPAGAAIGGFLGALAAEPIATAITPREETIGENIANVGLAAIQPQSRAGTLLARLGQGAKVGASLGAGHTVAQTVIDQHRLPTSEELLLPTLVGVGVGGGLEGIFGARLKNPAAQAASQSQPKEGSITASLDKRKPSSLEQANAQANQIASPTSATPDMSAGVTPSTPTPPVPVKATPQPTNVPFKLPKELAGAKPRYGFGTDLYGINFEDDLDKALYILAQKTPSKRDKDYLKLVMDHTGMTESQARAMGREVRNNIKSQVTSGIESDVIKVGPVAKGLMTPKPAVSKPSVKAKLTDPLSGNELKDPNHFPILLIADPSTKTVTVKDRWGKPKVMESRFENGVLQWREKGRDGRWMVSENYTGLYSMAQKAKKPLQSYNSGVKNQYGQYSDNWTVPTDVPSVAPNPPEATKGKRVSIEDEDAIDSAALEQEYSGSSEPVPEPAPVVNPVEVDAADEAVNIALTKTRKEVTADRKEYERLQQEMVNVKGDPAKLNEVWAASEAIKNKYGGMPPPEKLPKRPRKAPKTASEASVGTETPTEGQNLPNAAETPVMAPPEVPPVEPPVTPKPPSGGSGPEKGVRKPIQRVLDSDQVPQEFKAAVKDNPEILYDIQRQGKWADEARAMATDEIPVAIENAKLNEQKVVLMSEYRNRLIEQKKHKEAADLQVEIAKLLTPGGQLLRSSNLIKNPLLALAEAEELVAKEGKKLSEEARQKIVDLSSKEIATKDALVTAEKKAREMFDSENLKAYQDAKQAHAEAEVELDNFKHAIAPRKWDDMIANFIRGNLQTALSPISGFAGNLIFRPIVRTSESIASAADAGLAAALRAVFGNPIYGQRSIMKGNTLSSSMERQALMDGVKLGAKEILNGPVADSAILGEIHRGFRPFRSLIDGITGRNIPLNEAGEKAMEQRVKAIAEGTLGIAPETLFRIISLSDKPFRMEAYTRELANQYRLARNALEVRAEAELKKLGRPGPAKQALDSFSEEKFMALPPKHAEEAAREAGGYVTFSSKNKFADALNKVLGGDFAERIPILRSTIKVLGAMVVPFRQFPINYALTALNFAAPMFGYSKSSYYAWQSIKALNNKALNAVQQARLSAEFRRKSLTSFGEATMGLMMYGAAAALWENGLISEKIDKTAQGRSKQAEMMGAQRLNLSGLDRLMNGGDPTYQSGDKTIDWSRMGIPAAVFAIYGDRRMREVRKDEKAGAGTSAAEPDPTFLENQANAIPGLGSFIFDQSFLSGTTAFLEAMKEADPESTIWQSATQNLFRAATAVAIPSEVEAVARANMEFVPELRGKDMKETLKNIWEFKTLQLPAEDQPMAFKRDIWGEKVKRTPEGANPYIYNLADPFKVAAKEMDEYDSQLMKLYEETRRPGVYPNPVSRVITSPSGESYKLDPDDYEKLQEIVGKYRRQGMVEFLGDTRFASGFEPYEKVLALENIYEEANSQGREEFTNSSEIHRKYFSPDAGRKPETRSTESLIRDNPNWNEIQIR